MQHGEVELEMKRVLLPVASVAIQLSYSNHVDGCLRVCQIKQVVSLLKLNVVRDQESYEQKTIRSISLLLLFFVCVWIMNGGLMSTVGTVPYRHATFRNGNPSIRALLKTC